MDPIVDTTDRGKPERTGHDILDRALAGDGATTLAEATQRHCVIGWPPPAVDDARDDDAPITADELAAWDRVGRTLAAHPAALRRILAALSSIEPAHQPPSRRAP